MKQPMLEEQWGAQGADTVNVEVSGSFVDIIKNVIKDDTLSQKRFKPKDQQDRIARKVFDSLKDHTEAAWIAVTKTVAEKQRQYAAAGLRGIRESAVNGINQPMLKLLVDTGATLLLSSGIHVSVAYASQEDLNDVWKRQQAESVKMEKISGDTKKAFTVLIHAMLEQQAKEVRDLVS